MLVDGTEGSNWVAGGGRQDREVSATRLHCPLPFLVGRKHTGRHDTALRGAPSASSVALPLSRCHHAITEFPWWPHLGEGRGAAPGKKYPAKDEEGPSQAFFLTDGGVL